VADDEAEGEAEDSEGEAVGEHACPGAVPDRGQAVVREDLVGSAVVAIAPRGGDEEPRDGEGGCAESTGDDPDAGCGAADGRGVGAG
jgi:hypothetical protein